MGLREDILKPESLKPVPFPCEWGALYLRRFTTAQAAEWHKFAQTQTDDYGNLIYPDIFRAKLVQLSVCDENDQLVFKDSDVSALTGKSASTVAQVFLASCELNCLTNAEVAKARANFLQALKTALGSGSPKDSEKPTSPSSESV